MMGWQCPKCSACYAPFVSECYRCNAATTTIVAADLVACFHEIEETTAGSVCRKCGQRLQTQPTLVVIS